MAFNEKRFLYGSFVGLLLFTICWYFFVLFYSGLTFRTQNAGVVLTHLENPLAFIAHFFIAFSPGIIRITPEKTGRL